MDTGLRVVRLGLRVDVVMAARFHSSSRTLDYDWLMFDYVIM